jgi:hypothetical protein
MDTVDVRLTLGRSLDTQKVKNIEEEIKWISRLKYWDNKCSFIISFPKFFYPINNAYLVETQREIDLVLNEVSKIFENYKIEEAYTKRVDYPFTFIMPEGRTFNSYFELFRLVGIIRSENPAGNSKYYGSIPKDEKETVIFTNTTNTNNFSKKVSIYNQALKIQESRASSYDNTVEKFPYLERRMRIEVAFKKEINILDRGSLRLDLRTLKREAAYYIAEEIFNKKKINDGIVAQTDNLIRDLQEKYEKNINWNRVVSNKIMDPDQVISKDIFNAAIKQLNLSERGKQNARRTLRKIVTDTKVTYENIDKDIRSIMLEVLRQSREI